MIPKAAVVWFHTLHLSASAALFPSFSSFSRFRLIPSSAHDIRSSSHRHLLPYAAMASAELRQIVLYHLDQGLLNNALFLAGRLHALDSRNLQSIHLLALCHLRNTQARLAYHYTQQAARRGLHLGCAYVFAQACLDLNKRAEGIDALERVRHMWDGKNDWGKSKRSSGVMGYGH